MNRIVQPEWLDRLPPDDPRAIHSRRDLRRVNSWMRNHELMATALQNNFQGHSLQRITELGAGDGNFFLRVVEKISARRPDGEATLIDLKKNVADETLAAFASLGWRAKAVVADVFDWPQIDSDIVITNLFLHHFEDAKLAELLGLISRRTKLFIALEPRRAAWPLFCSRLLWAIGCNDVTRHDAAVSVRAGFFGDEISRLWPDRKNWELTEKRTGVFSHLFIARKIN
jgi:hypothetical protein